MPEQKQPPPRSTSPGFKWLGRVFKLRRFQPKTLKDKPPALAAAALVYMTEDYFQVACLGMLALAKDIYSRQPGGSREFERFAKSLGLQVVDAQGHPVKLAEQLETP